jgi:hypothetical protein
MKTERDRQRDEEGEIQSNRYQRKMRDKGKESRIQ